MIKQTFFSKPCVTELKNPFNYIIYEFRHNSVVNNVGVLKPPLELWCTAGRQFICVYVRTVAVTRQKKFACQR